MTIPVIIAHFGTSPAYLKAALTSADRFNDDVVLLGDRANQDFWKNHWDSDLHAADKYDEFVRHYVKMSDNPTKQDLSCWRRHFLLETWMREQGIQEAFLVDSDWVSFANYTEEVAAALPDDCAATLMYSHKSGTQNPYKWSASPHFSYWTLDAITEFTSYCIEAYKTESIRQRLTEKYQWHLDNQKVGGICDMTLLHLWREHSKLNIVNLTSVIDGKTLDLTLNRATNYSESEYKMLFGFKKLTFKRGIPYGYNQKLNQEVRFLGLHCQGGAKVASRLLAHKTFSRLYFLAGLFLSTKKTLKRLVKQVVRTPQKRFSSTTVAFICLFLTQ